MDDYTFLISDIEIEYKKYFDIVVKKEIYPNKATMRCCFTKNRFFKKIDTGK